MPIGADSRLSKTEGEGAPIQIQERVAEDAISLSPSSIPVVTAFMNSSRTIGIILATSDTTGAATDMKAATEGPAADPIAWADGAPFDAIPLARPGLLGTFTVFFTVFPK